MEWERSIDLKDAASQHLESMFIRQTNLLHSLFLTAKPTLLLWLQAEKEDVKAVFVKNLVHHYRYIFSHVSSSASM